MIHRFTLPVKPRAQVRVIRPPVVVFSMSRTGWLRPLLVATIACSRDASGLDDPPYLTGVIESRAPLVVGVRDGDSTRPIAYPRLRATDSTKSVERCEHSVVVTFSIGTPLSRRSGAPVDTGVLQVGQRVSVWTEDVFLLSCPPQTGARRLVIEDVR